MSKRPLQAIAIMGATSVGKSALAMELAAQHGLSIISCDSMQVYHELDIGTAKPSEEEQRYVPHEAINCAHLPELFSAAAWAELAREKIRAQNEVGRIAIVCGGTGLYLQALIKGFATIPEVSDTIRAHYQALQEQYGTPYLHAQLTKVDPPLASRLPEHDTQRILRGLGVYHSSGRPLSEWQQQEPNIPPIACKVFVLDLEREILRKRIADRFFLMIERGWLTEVQWLHQLHLAETHPAMRAVGYRQLLDYLDGKCSKELAIEQGITATRRFAKRQNTWFRHQQKEALWGDYRYLYGQMQDYIEQSTQKF
ncbi:MAG: tRNA (adenosine(37)-N6)-dimethylallyltransferase MiaA [Zetaproteobacteria bacterium]|nr:tRNA (adenosine(37)-N6)-dimethylallyltransferase MiaA [Zetaproteobacteria bacterium]